jgi:NAD(P)-dependent dehydrogenase (short-subunit alcohol dehydrogenase family)
MQLAGVAAVVTGGGSGLGEATSVALAAAGAKVAVLDINAEAAAAVAARIGGVAATCDVGDADSAVAALAIATAAHGPARVLVNCAGVANPGRIVGRDGPLPLAAFEKVIRINLIGTFNLLRLVAAGAQGLAPLEDGERGVIVNTASVAAYDGQIGQPAYGASKAGVVGLTLPAARELARFGIRVVTIAPGLFQTPMMASLPADAQASLGAMVPYPPRLGIPSEYAALVLHIVANRMLNGETIRLDGAIRLAPK